MAAPLDVSPSGELAPEAPLAGVSGQVIEGRSLGQIAWMRLRRDKVAMAGGVVVLFLILVAVIGPFLVQNPDIYHANLINPTFSRPNGPFGRDQPRPPARRRAGHRPGRAEPGRQRRAGIAADRVPVHRAGGRHRRGDGRHRRLFRRLGGLGDRPDDGRLPRLPAAGVRDRAGRRHPVVGVRPVRQRAADRPAGLRHRLLRLAVHGPDHPRPDAVAAGAGVRGRGPQHGRARPVHPVPRAAAQPGRRRSWSTPRC